MFCVMGHILLAFGRYGFPLRYTYLIFPSSSADEAHLENQVHLCMTTKKVPGCWKFGMAS